MNTYLVTATFKNVALMGAAYDLFLKVIEDGTLNDEFEGCLLYTSPSPRD